MQGGHPLAFLYTAAPTRRRTVAYLVQMGSSRMPDGEEQTRLHRALVLDEPEKVLGFP